MKPGALQERGTFAQAVEWLRKEIERSKHLVRELELLLIKRQKVRLNPSLALDLGRARESENFGG